MGSSVGRIALGLVGAAIGAPFGLSAIGFSIGSAIGGAIFAPDGPKTEGPRLGDTSVSASNLGKIIPEHYGVTRTGGNMIWSAGLMEVKKVEEVEGGKGGGPTATNTTYSYFCSFAMALGRGQARSVRRIWADGKLIYDTTGTSQVSNSKYKFRFRKGRPEQAIDPLIRESIHRRLAGMPDVSAGNQEPAKYTTMEDLIAQTASNSGQRSQLYADLLTARKVSAEAGLPSGAVPDYRFVSAYRDLVYIVFENMPLEDFGNRIPNITTEIVWEGAGTSWIDETEESLINATLVPELSAGLAAPAGLLGLVTATERLVAVSGTTVRRFALSTRSEETRRELTLTQAMATSLHVSVLGSSAGQGIPPGTFSNVQIHATLGSAVYATATYTFIRPGFAPYVRNVIMAISEVGLNIADVDIVSTAPSFMGAARVTSTVNYTGGSSGGSDFLIFAISSMLRTSSVPTMLMVFGNTVRMSTMSGSTPGLSASVALPTTFGGQSVPNAGPAVYIGTYSKKSRSVAVRFGPNAISVHHLTAALTRVEDLDADGGVRTRMSMSIERSGGKVNPFPSTIQHLAGVITDASGQNTYVVAALADGTTGVIAFDSTLRVSFETVINLPAPDSLSGMSGTRGSPGLVAFGSGTKIGVVELYGGESAVYNNVAETPFEPEAQVYIESISGLLAWNGDVPYIYYIDRATLLTSVAAPLRDVVRSICLRAGMDASEFDVTGLPVAPVRGLSLTRAASARTNLEVLTQTYFLEGIETDWKVKFKGQSTTPVRRIKEKELGSISAPTGNVNWMETRAPEHSLPSQINLNYADPLRDYQNGTAHQRRISAPISSMFSESVDNIELPMSILESDAQAIAERLLYQTWMQRESSKSMMSWGHADLDPGDMVEIEFKDGRIITERLMKTTFGANFEVEMEGVRGGDPVFVPSPSSVIATTSVPGSTVSIPVPSRMFAFDVPLLMDYHSIGNVALRFYTALGADSERWRSGSVYLSWDGGTYNAVSAVPLDVTWGQVVGALDKPRTLWSTDEDSTLTVSIVVDRGDIVSVTRTDILNGANKALIWNPDTGVAEVIQFMDAELSASGTEVVLRNLIRGLRGTEYAADSHVEGEYFILLNEATVQLGTMENSRVNTPAYFKGVSSGQVISAVQPAIMPVVGRSLMPWAPSRVRRSSSGGDLTITWNRRTRISGGWNMGTGIETVPLNEDSEFYEFYLINGPVADFDPNDPTKYHLKRVITSPTTTIASADLTSFGLTSSDEVGVAIYQVSAQVGRGFGRIGTLVP